jgi:hypothetical protein
LLGGKDRALAVEKVEKQKRVPNVNKVLVFIFIDCICILKTQINNTKPMFFKATNAIICCLKLSQVRISIGL